MSPEKRDQLLNEFAIRCFRDIADGDYIAARMACRAQLATQFLWASQQAVEKYLKCILLLNRISATKVHHDLGKALAKIKNSEKIPLELTGRTQDFIERLDTFGQYRYLEVSNIAFGADLVNLDRAAWELRRYCTLTPEARLHKLRQGTIAPKVRIEGGCLEKWIDDAYNPAREPLLWQNAFFGKRSRKRVSLRKWWQAHNAPLWLNPEILDEVVKYVFIPPGVQTAYRAQMKESSDDGAC